MNPKIDKKKCIGCGVCAALCPEVFKLDARKSFVKKDAPIEDNQDCIKEAIQSCPTDAISCEKE